MDRIDIVFLVSGVVVVFVAGRLLTLTGRRYVGGAGGAGTNVGTFASLLSTVFHLVTLGLTVLIGVLPVGPGLPGYLVRLGILLVVLGIVYGAFVGALARRREVAITEVAVAETSGEKAQPRRSDNPSVPSHSPSYLPPSGLPGSGDGT